MQTVLRSTEFSCPSCVDKIEKHVSKLSGVTAVTVHFATGRIVIDHDETRSTEDLIKAVGEVGYTATARRSQAGAK